jgi:hypothetical protein
MGIKLNHATPLQLGKAFREKFSQAEGVEAARLSKWLLDRINDGTFSSAQVRAFFEIEQKDWSAFYNKLSNTTDNWVAVCAAEGV